MNDLVCYIKNLELKGVVQSKWRKKLGVILWRRPFSTPVYFNSEWDVPYFFDNPIKIPFWLDEFKTSLRIMNRMVKLVLSRLENPANAKTVEAHLIYA